GGLGRLAACFLDSMATLQLPAMGYGLRYEYGMFKQSIQNGWQQEQPDNWLRRPDPWEIARLDERVEVRFGCSFALRGSNLELIPNRPSTLIGIPFDRPIVGYGGTTVNTLRLWSAIAPDYFDFQRFSAGEFVGALAETLAAESLTRVLYPDDSTTRGQGLRFVQEYFLVACSLADLTRRFRRGNADWHRMPDKAAIQLNDTHPALAVPELMRILLDEGHLGWDEAWDLTQRTLTQHQRRCRDTHRPTANDDRQGSRRDLSRAVQQQDKRCDSPQMAAAREPRARRRDFTGDRRQLDCRPRPTARPASAGSRSRVPRRVPEGEAHGEGAV